MKLRQYLLYSIALEIGLGISPSSSSNFINSLFLSSQPSTIFAISLYGSSLAKSSPSLYPLPYSSVLTLKPSYGRFEIGRSPCGYVVHYRFSAHFRPVHFLKFLHKLHHVIRKVDCYIAPHRLMCKLCNI